MNAVRRDDAVRAGTGPRVAVLGAGVIGRVLAARLVSGGVDTVLVARGRTLDEVRERGIRLRMSGNREYVGVPVTTIDEVGPVDVLFLCLRADALDAVLPQVAALGAPVVVPMMHLGSRHADLVAPFGADRVVRAFPGYGGYIDHEGTVEWLDLGTRQPTTVEAGLPGSDLVVEVVRAGGLAVEATTDMDGWMAAHVVLISAMGAAILAADGDLHEAARRGNVRALVEAIRDGFLALRDRGVAISPRSIDVLFMRMPRWFAVEYWHRALPGPVGAISMRPHTLASRDDELPVVFAEALRVTGGGRTGALARLLAAVP